MNIEEDNVTHIGFYSNDNIIVWNEVTDFYITEAGKNCRIDLKYKISDLNTLFDLEDKTFFFLKDKNEKICYGNIVLFLEKKLYSNGLKNKGIELRIITENELYDNSYPYNFVYKNTLLYRSNNGQEIDWDFIKKELLLKYENIELYFFNENLIDLFNRQQDSVSEIKKHALFTVKVIEGESLKKQ